MRRPLIPLLFLCLAGTFVDAQAQEPLSPSKVKAAFLFNFALFSEWPASDTANTFTIAVLGDSELAAELPGIVAGRTVRNRVVRIHALQSIAEFDGAHILYVGANAIRSMPHIRKRLEGQSVLVVSDAKRLPQGTIINFVTIDRRIRFEVSLTAAQRAGVKLSSRLLGAAIEVDRGGLQMTGDAP